MRLPIQALELARFADLGQNSAIAWISIKPVGKHIMQASATNGASLAQYAWIDVGHDKREVCLNAEDVMKMLKDTAKKDRLLGGSLNDNVLQIGNELGKPVRVVPHEEINFPPIEQAIPEDALDPKDEGPRGSVFGMDLRLLIKVQEWLRGVGGNPVVKIITRGPQDPVRIDVATFETTGGTALFVVMPARL